VTAAARRQPGGADAVFTVLAGPKARVGAARIEGAGGLEAVLRRYIRPAPGRVFLRDKARSAAEAMRRQLVRDGRWRAQVALDESYDPAKGRVTLVFRAQPGPLTAVEFQGAHLASAVAPSRGCSRRRPQGGRGEEVVTGWQEFHRASHRDVR
jgi:outer membrane protein assembly factor BamA